MKDALSKFIRDVLEAGAAAGIAAVATLSFDAGTTPKIVVYTFLFAFFAGAIAAARRYLIASQG